MSVKTCFLSSSLLVLAPYLCRTKTQGKDECEGMWMQLVELGFTYGVGVVLACNMEPLVLGVT